MSARLVGRIRYSQGANERKGFISFWQGVYEAPPPAPAEPIKKETAETLLRKIIELNDPKYAAAAFILAVRLERKRMLKVKEQIRQGGRRLFIYEQPKTGEVFTVPDPDLQLNQLEQVQHDVVELLEHGLPTQAAPASDPPSAPVAEASATEDTVAAPEPEVSRPTAEPTVPAEAPSTAG